ncbi:toxic anion resistance family protein [Helicobacter aurati]|uniref:Toxic anion resistance family protein n=1 Tax=Helicobacter aurati TaxID=137778 RepID=A0A3D8J6E2_9HELI|nr:toxic anion resistance protein [Helicobacter aurati]RDU72381.1 toxic anion resistance family protein [Helicobacter aurati]
MSNTIITQLQNSLSHGKISRDIVDNFAAKEKAQSMQVAEAVQGNLASLEGRDKVVFDSLKSLQESIDSMNPYNFKPSFFERLFGRAQQSMKQYFSKFQSNQSLLNEILQKLEEGKQTLLRDNVALEIEASKNAELAQAISKKLEIANEANHYLESQLQQLDSPTTDSSLLIAPSSSLPKDSMESSALVVSEDTSAQTPEIQATITNDPLQITLENREEIQKNILFPLKQQIMDFQQQILVHKQGEIALKTLINNNKELANSVDRTKAVTLNALNVAIITAQGLEQQQRVLSAVQNINTQTSNLIAHTSEKLREQGKQIQEGASNAMLDMDKLKSAFDNILGAMDDIKNFKLQALPKMQKDIQLYQQYLDDLKKKDK